ncbi:Coronin-like protein crn1 [Malassezia nana]|uniref:Coronin n=1 Tax=Malassezia nana TaxID=180528 RepID=A0AAF0EPH3_9BASI|nr:Coronin-like protein crn1 [Malassezia nana]
MSGVPPLLALTESAQKGSKKSSVGRSGKAYKPRIRARKGKGETLSFDEEARREYLTGFSKRKQQRKQAAHELVQRKIREEIRQTRLAAAEARRRQAAENVRAERIAMGLEDEDEDERVPTYEERHFETDERRAHVTVQELDLDDFGAPAPKSEVRPPSSIRAGKMAAAVAQKTQKQAAPAQPSGSLTAILEPEVTQAAQEGPWLSVPDSSGTSSQAKKHYYLIPVRKRTIDKSHVYGNPAKKEASFDNVKVSNNQAWDTNLMAASGQYVSLNWNVSGGGAFALLPLSSPGKLPDLYPLCRGHTSAVLDTAFSPFDDKVIVSGGDDAHLSLWRVSPDELVQRLDAVKDTGMVSDIKPQARFLAGKRRVGHVEFHPTAANVVAAATGDHAIKLFDMEKQVARTELSGFTDSIQSMAFDQTGSTIVATCRDRKLRLFDTRSPTNVVTTEGHGGIKGARVVWCGDRPRLITTGFSKMSERQMFLWDAAQFSKPLKTLSLDSSNGIIMPFWSDNGIVFLAGKGDGNIRYYELDSDELHFLSEYKSVEPQSGMAFLPRRALNVSDNEIARVYKVSQSLIQPVSFYVPRKSEAFQADIFPPAPSMEPAMTASEFFDEKKTRTPNLVQLEDQQGIAGEAVAPLAVASEAPAAPATAPAQPEPSIDKEASLPKAKEADQPVAQPVKAETRQAPEAEVPQPKETQDVIPPTKQPEDKVPGKVPADDASKAAQAFTVSAAVDAAPAAASIDTAPGELEQQLADLRAQLKERDMRIRELEMANLKYVECTHTDFARTKRACARRCSARCSDPS